MRFNLVRKLCFFIFCLFLSLPGTLFSQTDPSLNDGKARIYSVTGHAVITRAGNPIEKKLRVGDEIQAGDSVTCGKGTSVSIQFDHELQNAVQIPPESRVVFESVEPTVIRIEDGGLFNIVDNLAKGSSWKVNTPAAVAAVRGTVFMVRYGISNGDYFAATIDVPDDGKNSAIEITSLTGGNSLRVVEGKSLNLPQGQALDAGLVQNLDPNAVKELQDFYAKILIERPAAENEQELVPAPVAEYTETLCDASGTNCSKQTCRMTEAGKVCTYE